MDALLIIESLLNEKIRVSSLKHACLTHVISLNPVRSANATHTPNRGDVKAVCRLQKMLMKSWSGKMLAVRRVTQDNQGVRHQKVLVLKLRLFGKYHADVATSYNNMAELYQFQRQYSKAEPLYQKALKIAELSLGVDHPSTATIRENLKSLRDNYA